MGKATEVMNVKQTINGCGNLAFTEHEICPLSSSNILEVCGTEMTNLRNKCRAKQSKPDLCHLSHGSKSGGKTPQQLQIMENTIKSKKKFRRPDFMKH